MKQITAGSHRSENQYKFLDGDGVVFMLAGRGHAPTLCTAIFQLRHRLGFNEQIAIVTTDEEARWFVQNMLTDDRFDIEHVHHPMKKAGKGKGGHYANKTRIFDATPFRNRTVFLDADTLVMKIDTEGEQHLAKMLPPNQYTAEVMLTQFADWVTTGQIVSKRIKRWEGVPGAELLPAMLANPYPAINTGVFGFSKLSKEFFRAWNRLAMERVSFICDEIACQLMFPNLPHAVRRHEYNASVIYSTSLSDDDVVVWHGHGGKFAKSPKGRAVFMPIFLECIRSNFGEIQSWLGRVNSKVCKVIRNGKYQTETENWNQQFADIK